MWEKWSVTLRRNLQLHLSFPGTKLQTKKLHRTLRMILKYYAEISDCINNEQFEKEKKKKNMAKTCQSS